LIGLPARLRFAWGESGGLGRARFLFPAHIPWGHRGPGSNRSGSVFARADRADFSLRVALVQPILCSIYNTWILSIGKTPGSTKMRQMLMDFACWYFLRWG
jgi:hypothetical protein